jgi:putative ABC transport system ATP-binding protein
MSEVASLRRVSKMYRRGTEEIHALSEVSLDIHAGELTAVVGPSGSGKTSLLNVLGCVDTPTSGEIRVGDLDPAHLTDSALAKLRQSHVGFVFQQFFLIPSLTAEENVLMPTLFSRKKRAARELLDLVGLGHRAKHRPGEMSGGEMQRVAIARALVNEPRLLLADEPTGNLDTARASEIFALLERIASGGTAVVIVTHNDELAHNTRRVLRMRDGRLVSDAPGRASAG